MKLIKRLFRDTSSRLLASLGAGSHSREFVLGSHAHLGHPDDLDGDLDVDSDSRRAAAVSAAIDQMMLRGGATESIRHAIKSQEKRRTFGRNRKASKKNCDDPLGLNSDALLVAAKSNLPPVQFHHVHGPNALLSANRCVARRTHSFCQALVFSSRVILPNERVYIKVLEIAKGWSGTIRFGFTSVDPATLSRQMPKHACPDMTNEGRTWARALADEVVRRNSVIHFSYNSQGYIHYGINNQDCGIFYANVDTSQQLWFIIDIYGLTAAVELIDPRVNNVTSLDELGLTYGSPRMRFGNSYQLDEEGDDNDHEADLNAQVNIEQENLVHEHELRGAGRPMDVFRKRYFSKRSKSSLQAQQLLQQQQNLYAAHLSPTSRRSLAQAAASIHSRPTRAAHRQQVHNGGLALGGLPGSQFHARQNMLPNLNSVFLPAAEQNIYTPMPHTAGSGARPLARGAGPLPAPLVRGALSTVGEQHDYHQIVTNGSGHPESRNTSRPIIAMDTSIATATSDASAAASAAHARASDNYHRRRCAEENELSNQLELLQISQHENDEQVSSSRLSSSIQASSKSKKSTQSASALAVRRRSQQTTSQVQGNDSKQHKRQSMNQDLKLKSILTNSGQQSSNASNASSSAFESAPGSSSSSTSTSKSKPASSASKSRARQAPTHSNNKLKSSSTSRDNNNNTPPSKDCPICFERPINCVLYQCGHMCTCYECGVKQWRTQSRTCPICRTIIKDVIKTYMS